MIRLPVSLGRFDAELRWIVSIPYRIGPQRLHVTVVALGLSAEKLIASRGRLRIETSRRRLRGRQGRLKILERGQSLGYRIAKHAAFKEASDEEHIE